MNDKIKEFYEELKIKEKEIREKDNEIKKLYKMNSRYPFELSEGEKMICVIFISVDQKIHYPIICKNTDLFYKIERILYDEYKSYEESENIFLVDGKKINKAKTLKDNNIKNGDIITLSPFN